MRKVFVVFAFAAIALFFSFSISAQSKRVSSDRQAQRSALVTAELDRQRLFLMNMTSRYDSVAVSEFTPYFSYSYVWRALKENRDQLSQQRKGLTAPQFAEVEKCYSMLERDVLQQFVDQQLSVFDDELDLNDVQTDEIGKLLNQDLKRKRSLLSTVGLTDREFTDSVAASSEATEKQILNLLFPEQKEKFRQQVNFSRDRFVG